MTAIRKPSLPATYPAFLADLKSRIRTAQTHAALSVNRELIRLYWSIGRDIVQRQESDGWGKSTIERLSRDVQAEFPGIGGFSRQNIQYMRAFYLAWKESTTICQQPAGDLARPSIAATSELRPPEPTPPKLAPAKRQQPAGIMAIPMASPSAKGILQQPAGELGNSELAQPVPVSDRQNPPPPLTEIPWFHNVILISKLKSPAARLWYAQQTLTHGWSRNILALQIQSKLHLRQGQAVTNFAATLPPPQSDLAQQVLKDPYVFDFLTLGPAALERALETDLVNHITQFLLELGAGFAFVGRQYHLEVDGEDYYLDLLFYHIRLHCYLVLDLKTGPFQPEHAGKMNFYLSAVDDLLRTPGDQPAIGLILCRDKRRVTAEYALRDLAKPIGVAGWQAKLTATLPKRFRGSLPTVQELQRELVPAKG